MKITWKRLYFLLFAFVLTGLIFVAVKPKPLKVEAARVTRGPLRVTVDAEGKTRVRDLFRIDAPVAGKLSRINLHRGDLVEKNAVIAQIEPLPLSPLDPRQRAEATARVTAAQATKREIDSQVEHLQADYEQARRERLRAEKLASTGDISHQDLERIQIVEATVAKELEGAKFKSRAAAADVDVAKSALMTLEKRTQNGSNTTVSVRSPIQGKVLKIIEESERIVSPGTPLLELSNPAQLEVVIEVLSSDAVKISPGVPVIFEEWGGEKPLEGRVRLVEPSAFTKVSALGVEEQRVNVIADFLEKPDRLGDAFRVEAHIVIWENANVVKVPASSLFRSGSGWSVFVVENRKSWHREVEIGHRTAFEVEIVKGIQEGSLIILHPSNQIQNGVWVD